VSPGSGSDWEPTAPLAVLRLRARLLGRIRRFFEARGVLEVETPLLGTATATDPHIESVRANVFGEEYYLQTSPELFMKRLLAAGSGPIFQIARAFRDGERGSRHNPEFTLVEWYRPGLDHHALMNEVDAFFQEVLGTGPATRESYEVIFQRHVGVSPHHASAAELQERAAALGLPPLVPPAGSALAREDWLNLLMAQVIEPALGFRAPAFVYDFPLGFEAMARVRPGSPPVVERFEVFFQGMELANGYHELTSASEQRERFRRDLEERTRGNRPSVRADERLLGALGRGLPPSSGVALGLDRLVMIASNAKSIRSALSFSVDRA
jgi:elongation factor P--(R)-beta-lysine ligase